nr:retrovirus-related Pol polyprotein from transposon TNT 1-94 [Tanacetum cinerariifolium]
MFTIFNVSSEDFLEDLFPKQPSGNPTFSLHQEITSSEVTHEIHDLEGCNFLSEELPDIDSFNDIHSHFNDDPLSGSTSYSSNSLLEEFTDELALITYPPDYDDNIQFDIESDLKEIEFLLYQVKDSGLKDSIDQTDLANLDDYFVDPTPEMFTDEHAPDYSSPSRFDVYDDDFLEVESGADNVYDDPFDSKGEKIKESKFLIDELDLPCDFLPYSEYDSFNSRNFSRDDDLPSPDNEDKVFNPGILIHEKSVTIITRVAQEKKLAIYKASLVFEDFDPPFYEHLVFKDVPNSMMLLPFSSENEEKVFKPGIYTSEKVYSCFLPELSHLGYHGFKVNQIFISLMRIFHVQCGKNTPLLDVILGVKDASQRPIPAMPVPPAGQVLPSDVLNTHIVWVKASKEIAGLMLLTMDPDIQKNMEQLSAYDMLKELKTLGSRKLKPGTLSLYVGYGHRATVEAIVEFYLCLPGGLVLTLHNCHYAPSITRGIISVSRLYKDGFVNHFENDNTISVYRNNLVYFSAIPRDDFYEIELSSYNTNDSSIKKRIEKLQHDGLLNSTDIKSFEKCVSCMSGKIERKPYSHQVKRAKDLLGLIWTDEVETQLKKTIKSLRSDRGGEYISQEFLDHLKKHGIVAHRTSPYMPQHNGYPKETIGYSFYYPPENKVYVTRNAELFENGLITQEASGSLKDLEIIQEEDTHPSIDTSLNHEEDDQEINEPQSDINLIQIQSMKNNKVWDLVNLPPDGKTIGSKWLFKKKTGMDGAVHTFKARLVARDSLKPTGLNEETFSHIAHVRAIRILIAIIAFYDYEIWQMDIKLPSTMDIFPKKSIWCNLKVLSIQIFQTVGVVDWKSTKQNIFATSSTDAEYIAAFDASKEAVWIRKFIPKLGVVPTIEEPINMYCDSIGAIAIAKDHGITKGARHFRAKVHYLRETIEMGDVRIEKVDTYDNLADPFTKALAFPKHFELNNKIEMISASSLM